MIHYRGVAYQVNESGSATSDAFPAWALASAAEMERAIDGLFAGWAAYARDQAARVLAREPEGGPVHSIAADGACSVCGPACRVLQIVSTARSATFNTERVYPDHRI